MHNFFEKWFPKIFIGMLCLIACWFIFVATMAIIYGPKLVDGIVNFLNK